MPAKKKPPAPSPRPKVAATVKRTTSRKARIAAKPDLVTIYCSRCGTAASAARGTVPVGWSVAFERGRLEYLCPSCARTNIRAIEGRLPEEWWE